MDLLLSPVADAQFSADSYHDCVDSSEKLRQTEAL
jgi:hypothetical protein